jgi:F-type H+-transporting ATPase subunit delta
MTHFRVARRYARALIILADEQDKLEVIVGDLERTSALIRSSRELQLFLQNPTIGKEKKRVALREIFSTMVDDLTLKFILLLVAKSREKILVQIIEQYRLMVDEKMGIVRANVHSVIQLDKKQEKSLRKQLEGFTGKKVEVTYSLDKSLKGGFLARIGDTVIDASVRRQLELLEKKFLSDGSMAN